MKNKNRKTVAYGVIALFAIFGAAGFVISLKIGNEFLAVLSCIPALAAAAAILIDSSLEAQSEDGLK